VHLNVGPTNVVLVPARAVAHLASLAEGMLMKSPTQNLSWEFQLALPFYSICLFFVLQLLDW